MFKLSAQSSRLAFALALVVAMVFQFAGNANALTPANYAKSVNIQAGANYAGGAALTDYPVLVRLDTSISGFSYSQFALANGGDLRFTAADGTTNLSFEIDQWNPGGISTAWVKIPSLANGGGTAIVAYWGNANAAVDDPNNPADVWTNGYDFVYHLGDNENDSSPNNHDLSTGSTSNETDAIISDGQDISDGGTVMSPTDNYLGIAGGAERSFSSWVRINKPVPDANDGMIGWGAGGNGIRWEVRLENAATNNGGVRVEVNGGFRSGPTQINDGNWHYVHVQMPGGTPNTNGHQIYVNGGTEEVSYNTGARVINTGQSVAVNVGGGGQLNNARPWAGQMDEVRVSTVVRATDWIQANYDSQLPASTFNTFGAVNILQTQATLTPADAGPTNANTVVYTVVFEQPVTGVSAANFSLETLSGDTTGTVNGTIGGSGDTYTVTVENLSGDGDIRLNLSDVTGISPAAGASGGFPITLDNTGPTITFSNSNPVVNSGDGTTISLSFSDLGGVASVNLTGGDLIANGTATATANIVNGTTDSAQIVLTNITGSKGDSIQYEIAPGIATDSVGNTSVLVVTPLTTVGNPTFEFHWALDGATTAVANSSFYPDRDGAMLGSTSPTLGIIGSGAAFDGTTTGGIIADSYVSVQGGTSRTLSMWVQSNSDGYFFEYGTNATGRRIALALNTAAPQGTTGSLRCEFQGAFLIGNDADVLADGQWHHVAFVIADNDGSGLTQTNETLLYADGALNTIDNQGGNQTVDTGPALPVFLGARSGGFLPLTGAMDDVAIWSRVLSGSEIRALQNLGTVLGYNASEADCLFELYAAQTGTETIQGEVWEPVAGGLTGLQGFVEVTPGGATNLRLDAAGGGVRIPGAPIVNDPLNTDNTWNMFE